MYSDIAFQNHILHYNDVIMGTIAYQITGLTTVYSTVYSDADQRKYQGSASLAFVRGIHRRPVNSPHKWPVLWKMFPFDDVIVYMIISRRVKLENWTRVYHYVVKYMYNLYEIIECAYIISINDWLSTITDPLQVINPSCYCLIRCRIPDKQLPAKLMLYVTVIKLFVLLISKNAAQATEPSSWLLIHSYEILLLKINMCLSGASLNHLIRVFNSNSTSPCIECRSPCH